MRIVLNTSTELDNILMAVAKREGKSVNQLLIEDAESKYLQTVSNDTLCLNNLITDAISYSHSNPIDTRFTVSNLNAINDTMLQDKIKGQRSAQRASVTRRFIRAIKDGAVPNVCCLLDNNGDAIKIKRNSAFIIVTPDIYQSIKGDKVIHL